MCDNLECRTLSHMNKNSAAEFLGVSLRSLERYVRDKRIAVTYIDGSPDFTEEELTRFKSLKQEPIYRAALMPNSNNAMTQVVAPEYLGEGLGYIEAIASHYELSAIRQKLLLTLTEAAKISGLSKAYLNANILAGYLRGRN